jgi:hypothetical protein
MIGEAHGRPVLDTLHIDVQVAEVALSVPDERDPLTIRGGNGLRSSTDDAQ